MWESILGWEMWGNVGNAAAWMVTSCLLVAGLIGCVLPVLPGHVILLIGVIAHQLMLGSASGIEWWTYFILILLMAASQTFEIASGAAGAKWFGGTRWGVVGAFVGSIVGLFFLPFGLLLGPLGGAFAAEMLFARKNPKFAASSGVGSVVGTLAGMAVKIVIGILMVVWFLADVFWIGN
jgi:uncharacterized protein YqgC (DUF456 family)